jgi:hypothetical protein
MEFVGAAQTISGGTFQYFNSSNFTSNPIALRATAGGTVTLDSTVTIRSSGGSDGGSFPIFGNFVSNAAIVIDANSSLTLGGFEGLTTTASFINRGTITVPASRFLTVATPFTNEGQIIVNGGTMRETTGFSTLARAFRNTGTINLTGGGLLRLTSDNAYTILPADLGTIIDTGGTVRIEDGILLDNSGTTLVIDGTAYWTLSGSNAAIVGGTIQVDSTAKFEIYQGAVLKDVTVNGNFSRNFTVSLVGDVDFNGTITTTGFQFGHPSLYPGTPLIIRGGQLSAGVAQTTQTLTGYSTVSTITFDTDVVLKGGMVNATFTSPLTNRGRVVAEQLQEIYYGSDVFHFTAAPITNEGTLSAVNRATLRIANLAAPNSGIVSAGAGSSVQFTSTFAQAATGTTHIDIAGTTTVINTINGPNTTVPQFGSVAVTGAATLAGTLEIQFAQGYVPVVGDRYKVLTYASHTGSFSSVRVLGLPAGLVVTPQYNGTDLTLVISAG